MYEFLDRLINIALPRIKDFRGLSSSGIDNSFNYSFGIKEHIVFPEVNFDWADNANIATHFFHCYCRSNERRGVGGRGIMSAC